MLVTNFFIKAANFLFKFLHRTSDTYTKSDMIHITFETTSNIDAGGIMVVLDVTLCKMCLSQNHSPPLWLLF